MPVTRILGAVLAGGRAIRFGSDKAQAQWRGRTLLDWAVEALAAQVEHVVVCGHDGGLADRPAGRLGPLAGINAALHAGREQGFDSVVSLPCDTPVIAPDLVGRLRGAGPIACLADSPVIGLWPCALADRLDTHLRGADRSMMAWARAVGAVRVDPGARMINVNTPADLALLGEAGEPPLVR